MPRPRSNALTGPTDPRWPSVPLTGPTTRPRSNALAARNDPGGRSVAELEFYAELSKPLRMDPSLQSFLRGIYQRSDLMTGPDGLADQIYGMYSSDGNGSQKTDIDFTAHKAFLRALYHNVASLKVREPAKLQYTEVTLSKLISYINQGKTPGRKYLEDFIYFKIQSGSPQFRVYANAKFSHAPNVVAWLKSYLEKTPSHGVTAFKVVGPAAIAGRKDTIVIYCSTREAAAALGNELAKLSGHFNPELPAMTTPVKAGIGVATGAEPVWQATGLGQKPKGYSEKAQSFGTIRSELIAMAVLNYNANRHVFGEGFDVFATFVAAAFRGYGLDPERPGD